MICTELNEEIREKAIWVARLSNGLTAYQDDKADEVSQAWKNLKQYLVENPEVKIDDFFFKFRSHTYGWLDSIDKSSVEGFFFRKGIGAFMLQGGQTQQWPQYVCGHVSDNKVYVTTLMVPALHPLHTAVYDATDPDINNDIIYNDSKRTSSVPSGHSSQKTSKKQRRRTSK